MRHALSAQLSHELSNTYRVRSIDVRKGDTVLITRGEFKGIEGKVIRVERSKGFVYIEGVTRERADGSIVQVPIHASKVSIRQLMLDDKRRKEILERRAAIEVPATEENLKKESN
jgi:large subunit ribosomal protein L24